MIVGPTAEDVESRQRAAVDPNITKRLVDFSRQTVPELTSYSPVGHYTGIRPATQFKDYQIRPFIDRWVVALTGVRLATQFKITRSGLSLTGG